MTEEYKTGTLKDIAINLAEKQDHMVNTLLEETPLTDRMHFQPSTHGLWNAYEEVKHVDSVKEVDIDSPLPRLEVDSELKKVDLQIVGGEVWGGEDKVNAIGKDKYFANKINPLLRQAGQDMEKRIIYKNLLPFAIDAGHAVDAGGVASAKGYSIIAYREIEGENIGLYNPKGFGSGTGKLLDVRAYNGGNLTKDERGVPGYGMRLKGYIGLQLANKDGIAAIVNITKDKLPTEEMIDDLILTARADKSKRAFIYMHPKMLSLLNKYKANILQTTSSDNGINRTFTSWNGVEIITSYNFDNGTEKHITL